MSGRDGKPVPPQQPTTTRVGSGRSSRAAGLVVAALLAGIVWVGASGRSAAPPVDATPRPRATPVTARATAVATPDRTRVYRVPRIQLGEDAFAVLTEIEGRRYVQVLYDGGPGILEAGMSMAFPRETAASELQLAQLWTREDERRAFVPIARFDLPLDVLVRGTSGRENVVDHLAPAQPDQYDAPRLVRRGYRLSVTLESRRDHGFMIIDVRIGGPRPPASLGDDGLIGHPGDAERGLTR